MKVNIINLVSIGHAKSHPVDILPEMPLLLLLLLLLLNIIYCKAFLILSSNPASSIIIMNPRRSPTFCNTTKYRRSLVLNVMAENISGIYEDKMQEN